MNTALFFIAEDAGLIDEGIQFNNLPPNYVAWFLIPALVIAFCWWVYRRENKARGRLAPVLTALRVIAVFIVVFLIFDPYKQFRKIEEVRSMVTVLVDESASMARRDRFESDADHREELSKLKGLQGENISTLTRSELLSKSLGSSGLDLITKIQEKHSVKIYGFSTGKPRPLADLDSLSNEGAATATGDALAHVISDPDVQVKPNASVLILSDGRVNAGINAIDIARHAGTIDKIPVHAIGIGDPSAHRDLELRFVRADEVVLRGDTLKLELTVRNRGYESFWSTITVRDDRGLAWMPPQSKKIEQQDSDQVLELDIKVDRPKGNYTLTIAVAGPDGEENTENNYKKHIIRVKEDKLRVLYVDTLPRWEYRRLKNFLVRGEQSFLTHCLLLSAEPNFIQEHSQQAGLKSLREFPRDFATLDKYDVIIFGDVNPNLLAPTPPLVNSCLENLKKFVDNGGGLAVVAGDGWMPQAFVDTPIEEVLPVDITFSGDSGPLRRYVDEWKPKLTALGRMHPIMQLRRDREENRRVWEERDYGLWTLRWWYPLKKAGPGSQVLAYHPDARNRFGNFPVFVTGSYGEGPVFFSAIDETWRWFHQVGASDFNSFWGNVVRYLARSHLYRGSKRYKLVSSASRYHQGETINLTAFVKDKNFENSIRPTQRVMISSPDSKNNVVEFEQTSPGQYEHSFTPPKYGQYQAWIVGDEGLSGPRFAPITFEVEFSDPEKRDPSMDELSLKQLTEAGGGSYLRLNEAENILDRLQADTTRQSSVISRPLKSKNWLPFAFLLVLTIEWLLRKRFNMT